MKHKRFYFCGFSALAWLLLSLFLPTGIVTAASANRSLPARANTQFVASHLAVNAPPNAVVMQQTSAWPAYFAPYVYVVPGPSEDSKPSAIVQAAQQTGVKYYTLAFVISQGCKATWGDFTAMGKIPQGVPPGTADPMMTAINQLRQLGGDVAISFGGAKGTELAQACTDVPSLQQEYQSAIFAYQVTHLDFDIEGAAMMDTASIDRRNKAIFALEQTNPNLTISYTLPAMPTGLTADGMNILKNALANQVKIDVVNIMAMDYGARVSPKKMGATAISAAKATKSQLSQLGISAKLGITPMIGANDTVPETFTLNDARQVLTFAKQNNYIGELSMWSLGRDKPCTSGTAGAVLSTCSGIAQNPYDFTRLFGSFTTGLNIPGVSTLPILQDWFFPCSDEPSLTGGISQPSEKVISQDWLSGTKGRFSTTYAEDTYAFPQVSTLSGYMEGLAFLLIIPSILLLGYQIMLGASTFRYAGALDGVSRILLGGMAVAVSFTLVQMLIHFENTLTAGIILLHSEQPFPRTTINGAPILYMLPGEPATSYRGIIVPMSRWGCALNDFAGIFSPNLVADLASNMPLLGGFVHLTGTVTTMADLIRRMGEIVLTLLSALLWVQVFVRILLLNYYILVAPLAFGCWALPGGVGQNVVSLWCKGFLSVLFVQAVQLFILTTLPLILPPPQIPPDRTGILEGLLLLFPPILALCIMLIIPTLVGASITKALGAASSVTREVVVAVGTGSLSVGQRRRERDTEHNQESNQARRFGRRRERDAEHNQESNQARRFGRRRERDAEHN